MRVQARLAAVDWKYALRELTLIIAGILVALWLNDWNANRHQRQAEIRLLREISSALSADLANVKEAAAMLRLSGERTGALRDHIRRGLPYSDSLRVLFGSAYGFRLAQINTAPYEALKARGLDLISDDGIRMLIIRVYDTGVAEIRQADEISTNVSFEVLRPYYLTHFRDIQFLENATPIDYSAVAQDSYFHNLLDYRLTVLRRGILSRYDGTIHDMTNLLEAIDDVLSRRSRSGGAPRS